VARLGVAWQGKTRQGFLLTTRFTNRKEKKMKTFVASLKSVSPYSQAKYHQTEKLPKEIAKDYEERTWRDRMHVNKDGYVFIPPMAFKNCLSDIAKYISMQIPGKGKTTYTKHFEAGILVISELVLPVKKEDVAGEWLFVPADGRRGGTIRVLKCFSIIPEWQGDVEFHILDETITEDVFRFHLSEAGKYIGIGRFRPRKNGFYGRFSVENLKVVEG